MAILRNPLASNRDASAAPPTPGRPAALTSREQFGLALLALERVRRSSVARLRRSRMLRWRYRSPPADDFLLTPPDLRVQDPSFAEEIDAGNFGLAGQVVRLAGASPFAIKPVDPAWARALHGFGWLQHFDIGGSVDNEAAARALVADWLRRRRSRHPQAWEMTVTARRVISWLAHAGLLLDGADRRLSRAITNSLTDEISFLSASWRDAPDGYPRLLPLIAIVLADLCIAGHDRQLDQSERWLAAELDRQITSDGAHISRNPAILVELLLDLLPLRQCFAARARKPDPLIRAAIARIGPMLRHLRLGDGTLARFNGMGASERDSLATVLAYDIGGAPPADGAPDSGYVRLARGPAVLIADAGTPPALELAHHACAGALSFELSIGTAPLLVNAGAPGSRNADRLALSRATASHSTLVLNEQSSAKLVRSPRIEAEHGSPPLSHPDRVACAVREADGGVEAAMSHDGYVERYGLVHARTLRLNADGSRLDGLDRLAEANGVMRFVWDLPFAVHFHLHPTVKVRIGAAADSAELRLGNGERWRLLASGAALAIEADTHFADPAGARPSRQIVLRGTCPGAAEVSWTLERVVRDTRA